MELGPVEARGHHAGGKRAVDEGGEFDRAAIVPDPDFVAVGNPASFRVERDASRGAGSFVLSILRWPSRLAKVEFM